MLIIIIINIMKLIIFIFLKWLEIKNRIEITTKAASVGKMKSDTIQGLIKIYYI